LRLNLLFGSKIFFNFLTVSVMKKSRYYNCNYKNKTYCFLYHAFVYNDFLVLLPLLKIFL
jgi:hypothetical protein